MGTDIGLKGNPENPELSPQLLALTTAKEATVEISMGRLAGRMKRKPEDLPSIVKRHFLRGLRGGSEQVPAINLSFCDYLK